MAKNSCGCGCNSCNNGSNCKSCASRFSSRGCGALRYLGRNSYTGCNTSGSCNNCNSCSRRNAYTDYPGASTCAGYPLYYTGPCGCQPCNNNNCGHCHHHCCCHHCHNNCCNNDCNNNCNNNNNCCNNDCCHECCESCPCDNCCDPCCDPCHCDECCHCCENPCAAAAEFIVLAPQHEYSGGAFTFAPGACRSDGFELCSGGVRISRPGRYIAVYSFSAPACTNAATTISFSLNGVEMIASRAFISPALTGDSRAAMGQALFEADAGDIIALNTSTAMNIPASISGGPIATVIIYSVD